MYLQSDRPESVVEALLLHLDAAFAWNLVQVQVCLIERHRWGTRLSVACMIAGGTSE